MAKKSINFDSQLNFKCTKEDVKIIKKKAQEVGKDVSNYMRSVSVNKHIFSKTDLQTVIQLRRIGGNVNQIAKKINSSTVISNPIDILNKLEQIRKELEEIKTILNISIS